MDDRNRGGGNIERLFNLQNATERLFLVLKIETFCQFSAIPFFFFSVSQTIDITMDKHVSI
jgi:hypothetical protein